MQISILTLFPEMFSGPFDHSIIKRAKDANKVKIKFVNIRNFGLGKHKIVDDTPYGGGVGMVMRVDVMANAIKSLGKKSKKQKIVLLSAAGKKFDQNKAREYSKLDHLVLICGHYEGIDERIKNFVDEEISIGDYVLTGGEIPAIVVTDSVIRLLEGVLKKDATNLESFSEYDGLLEHPQYTRPEAFDSHEVPKVLLSGNHKEIEKWKSNEKSKKTAEIRPDLLNSKKEN